MGARPAWAFCVESVEMSGGVICYCGAGACEGSRLGNVFRVPVWFLILGFGICESMLEIV